MREKESSVGKYLWTSAMSPTPIMPSRATRKEKDTEEDLVALEKVAERVIEDVVGETFAPQKVLPLLQYFDRKREKYARTTTNGSYVELVHNRTRAKVAATFAVAAKERQIQEKEAKYEVLQKRLAEEVKKQRYWEKTCEGLREDIENAKYATVDLRNRLEASRTVYNAESQRIDKLTTASKKEELEHAIELAAKMKDLAECEAARISDLELIEKLEAQYSELRSQRMQAEDRLCEMETRLSEEEEKNRQLSEQTDDILTMRVNQSLQGFVLWQVETHKWLQLQDLERRATVKGLYYGRSRRINGCSYKILSAVRL
ncbi:hypothetical protein AXG93_557s1050 [Marchantia polymorpha subsp. ruderalis]|uniref:Uncharacterized protein n=1 Tax=Marchantia polymorpha subsp. ruderalis TaxID=1480154 RepID=A0A176VSU0_MARPO|nr:hypothetical protein AXG93_557s1050 [Marchantia polymorpha subsp. ruderalis]